MTRPFGSFLTTMLANWRGSTSRPKRLDIQLEGAGARGRRLVEHARGDLDILRLKGGDDLAGGQVARRDLVGIEPDPHRIVARAKDPHVADAVEPRQHILHLQRGVVRDVELVARPVRRARGGSPSACRASSSAP